MRACILLTLALSVAGCDVGANRWDSNWSVSVVSASAEPDTVSRWGPIRLQLDRRVSPWSVDRGTVRLASAGVGELVFPSFDPASMQLAIDLTRPLLADTSYVIRLEGLTDLDGFALESLRNVLVRAVDVPAEEPLEPPDAGEVIALLRARCADGKCHGRVEHAADLVLDDASGIATTALGHASRQVASASEAPDGLAAGLIDLPIIDHEGTASSPARSYLTYKILGDEHVLGEPMPPAPAMPLSADETLQIARWIAAGAPTE